MLKKHLPRCGEVQKIKAVIDTNVFVSGVISPRGAPREILELAKRGSFKVIISIPIIREILQVLHRDYIYTKYNLNEEIIDDIAAFLFEGTILTEDAMEVSEIKQDPEDNKFLACALEGEADYIVSGDDHLLKLKHYKGIQIVTARSFFEIIKNYQK